MNRYDRGASQAIVEEAEQVGGNGRQRGRQADAKSARDRRVLTACRFIEERDDRVPSLGEIARHVGLSPYYLQRIFKDALGVTPRQYADAQRVQRLKRSLQRGEGIAPALYDAGYGSSSRLYEKAPRQLGMTPGAYRKGGEGEAIRYTVPKTSLGRILLAGTDRGICKVSMGASIAELARSLRREFPRAAIARDDEGLRPWVDALLDYLNGRRPLVSIPTDIHATAFQRRVWEELQAIPRGETRSYAEVARAIGKPRATRAVARACATNPVALVIPCHRVVRKDGVSGGYRWGEKRKRALLAMERNKAGSRRPGAGE